MPKEPDADDESSRPAAQKGYLESIRRQLIVLASRKDARVTEFSRARPTQWQPGQVRNPKTGFYYTHVEAWHLVVDVLRGGCDLEEIDLRQPPGCKAYAFTVALEAGRPKLYVKLELGSGKVIGRSFHYSKVENVT